MKWFRYKDKKHIWLSCEIMQNCVIPIKIFNINTKETKEYKDFITYFLPSVVIEEVLDIDKIKLL